MKDNFGRTIDNLRISVTQRCHYNCDFCHSEGETSPGLEMSLSKIKDIVSSAAKHGITHVKLTGGEPLLRKDIVEIVKIIKAEKSIEDISMATTGIFLPLYAKQLKAAGLDRVNVGCDTIATSASPKTAASIQKALDIAHAVGFSQIKINMVVLKDINAHEIPDMILFAKKNNVLLQLIELINTNPVYYKKYYYSLKDVEDELASQASNVITRKMHDRKQFHLDGLIVETVRPIQKHFCENCTRMRITSDGKLKPCLMRDDNLVVFKDNESFCQAIKNRSIHIERYNEEKSCFEGSNSNGKDCTSKIND